MSSHPWQPVCPPPPRLVRPVRVDPTGAAGPTRGRAAGPRWRQTSHGFYVPATVDGGLPEQRILEQAVRLPTGGAVTGWASCRMHRAGFFDGREPDGRTLIPVPLALGRRGNIRADPAVSLCWEPLAADEIVSLRGVPCTRITRALFDEMRRRRDLREAVVAVDMTAAACLMSVRRMREYAARRDGWRGVGLVLAALDLADEDSRSPNETRLRLAWQLDAGLPRPLGNQHVWDTDGRLLGIADLLDPGAGVVGEFDGADHRNARRHSMDVDREARFRDAGLELVRVTGPDLAHRDRVVRRIEGAYARARRTTSAGRGWTVTPPPGWEMPPTLDELLDERDARRALYQHWEAEGLPTL
ncbi:MAG: hypothetical protein ACXVXH_11605 [Nocardioidaceae bacterium]